LPSGRSHLNFPGPRPSRSAVPTTPNILDRNIPLFFSRAGPFFSVFVVPLPDEIPWTFEPPNSYLDHFSLRAVSPTLRQPTSNFDQELVIANTPSILPGQPPLFRPLPREGVRFASSSRSFSGTHHRGPYDPIEAFGSRSFPLGLQNPGHRIPQEPGTYPFFFLVP